MEGSSWESNPWKQSLLWIQETSPLPQPPRYRKTASSQHRLTAGAYYHINRIEKQI